MRLICVKAILDIEEERDNSVDKILTQFDDEELTKVQYAILSHCWGKNHEEVKLSEMEELPKLDNEARDLIRRRPGYKKIVKTCNQARMDKLEWVWVDTCCIDKGSSAELSEAINSMYRWYENARKCYAYLHDVEEEALLTESNEDTFEGTNGWPKWFSRGWTLQELIAPEEVIFFNATWEQLKNGTKRGLAHILSKITGIPTSILRYGLDSEQPCVAQIMSWAANRKTTRVEDGAYSLMGLFGVYMPMLYGEGRHAFRRLQLEILRTTNDHSIFAWKQSISTWQSGSGNVLAEDVGSFRNCSNIERIEPEEYRRRIEEDISGVQISEERLRTCSVTNAGIQIWLPVRQLSDSNLFEATLACRNTFGPIRIVLALIKSKYHRDRFCPSSGEPLQFQQLFLAYNEKTHHDKTIFNLNDSNLAQHGFVPEHIYPEGMTVTETTSLSANRYVAVSYLNQRTNTRFALLFGSFAGQAWAHLTIHRSRSSFKNYAETAYYDMGNANSKQAQTIAKTGKAGKGYCLVKRLHLSCSILDIRLIFQRLPQPNTSSVALDVVQCAGCCMSNDIWQPVDIVPGGEGRMLGDTRAVLTPNESESLLIDRIPTTFSRTLVEPGFELGDFGNWNNETFVREGNIFDHRTSVALDPVQHEICHRLKSYHKGDHVKFGKSPTLCLRQPRCLSLPDDVHVKEFLKALSPHLQGKCLVTTIVRCSELYITNYSAWASWPDHDEPASDINWEKVPISAPLFVPTRPLIWYRAGACEGTRTHFKEIRECFGVLSKPLDDRVPAVDGDIDFLSNHFGGQDLQDYIDENIQPQSLETCCEDKLGQVGVICRCSRIQSLANNLAQQMRTRMDGSVDENWCSRYYRRTYDIARKAVSKVFGPEVVWLMFKVYQKPSSDFDDDEDFFAFTQCGRDGCGSTKNNKDEGFMHHDCIRILFEEIEKLQIRLNECENDDEKRALEEDITGKILLACWRGVHSELAQVLPKVVEHFVHDKDVDCNIEASRSMFVQRIGGAFYDAAGLPRSHHLNHLLRITADAQAGISKHELLLDARKHSVAMLSGDIT